MAKTLDVYLHDNLTGHLTQDDHGQVRFQYTDLWLSHAEAAPLSASLPLRNERFTQNETRAFFAGILPEEDKRKTIAKNLGISANNDFSMLEEIGGECAGAVTFIRSGEALRQSENQYRELTDNQLAAILKELPLRPLLAGDTDVRLSLAGAQDKVAVRIQGETISIPLGNAPSSHIIKPAIDQFEGTVFNEAFCMTLAKSIGLHVANVELRSVAGIDYLCVERYDRIMNPDLVRLHQEDFCQALGIVPEQKYQNEGGPSIKMCFDLLRDISAIPAIDLTSLLDAVIFNWLIGNNDAHGKNFSLLRGPTIRLAPFYDLLCTAYYPDLTPKMAMKIGGEYKSNDISYKNFERLATEIGMAAPIVKRRLQHVANEILKAVPRSEVEHPVAIEVEKLVTIRCKLLLQSIPKTI